MAVQSVTRALDILRTIAVNPDGLGVSELARQTTLHKSTVYRLVTTLEKAQAIERIDAGQTYQIASDFSALFDQPTNPQNLIAAARPYLHELCNLAGEDAGLALPDGDHVIFVDQVMSDHALQVRDWTGLRFPMHEVAAGRIMLAFRTSAEINTFQQRWTGYDSFVDLPTLIADLPRIRAAQHAWIFQAKTTGLNAVAAPVLDAGGKVVASLCIYGPDLRFPKPDKRKQVVKLLLSASERLTQRLNFRPNLSLN